MSQATQEPLLILLTAGTLLLCFYIAFRALSRRAQRAAAHLDRHEKNPILSPVPENPWESHAAFNPAVVYDSEENVVHLFYRALGHDGMSRIGYAWSVDGVHFSRLPYPVYVHEHRQKPDRTKLISLYPAIHASGGGWSGSEDPRAVMIDGTLYLLYTAFEGWDAIRVTLTSLPAEKLKKKLWDFSRAIFLSPPGQVHKNWVLFPEKLHGKFAVITSVTPRVQIAYYEDEDAFADKASSTESVFAQEQQMHPERWEAAVRGAGPPPVRTEKGWLLFYHAIDKADDGKYKLGAMLLDLEDPTRVLYRAKYPVLAPEMAYENDGKPGVIYACGALVKDGTLFLYYGGADKVSCVATAPLSTFLDALINAQHPSFSSERVTV